MAGESPGVWAGRGTADLGLRGAVEGRRVRGAPGRAGTDGGAPPPPGARVPTGVRFRPGVRRPQVGQRAPPVGSPGARSGDRRRPPSRGVRRARLPRRLGHRRAAFRARHRPPPGHHRGRGRGIRAPDQPGPRSPPPHPSGGRQRGAGRRRPLVGARQSSTVPPPPGDAFGLRRVAPPPSRPCGRRVVASHPGRRVGGGRCRPGTVPALLAADGLHRRGGPSPVGGRGSAAVRRVAFHADRPAKDTTVTADELRDGWRRRASSLGLDTTGLVRVVGRRPPSDPGRVVDTGDLAGRLARMAKDRTEVTGRDLVEAVADAAPYGLDGARAQRAAAALGLSAGTRDAGAPGPDVGHPPPWPGPWRTTSVWWPGPWRTTVSGPGAPRPGGPRSTARAGTRRPTTSVPPVGGVPDGSGDALGPVPSGRPVTGPARRVRPGRPDRDGLGRGGAPPRTSSATARPGGRGRSGTNRAGSGRRRPSASPGRPRVMSSGARRRRHCVPSCSPTWGRPAPSRSVRGRSDNDRPRETDRTTTSWSPVSTESASSVRTSPMPGSTTVVPNSDGKPSAWPGHRCRAWERSWKQASVTRPCPPPSLTMEGSSGRGAMLASSSRASTTGGPPGWAPSADRA